MVRTSSVVQRFILPSIFILSFTTSAYPLDESPSGTPAARHTPSPAAIGPPAPESAVSTLDWDSGAGKSYLIPAVEILGYLFLLNRFDRHFIEPKDEYRTDGETIWRNLTDSKWVIDDDQFSTNQFLHPYGGTIYYGSARSAGLNFYESFLYTAAGSFLWEIGGERTRPSINDQITTTFGGTFLGEPLFRMAGLLLETEGGRPGFWRELGAAVISPPTGFNRLVFGNRFDTVFPGHSFAPAGRRNADLYQSKCLPQS
jgi:hypothetical protein